MLTKKFSQMLLLVLATVLLTSCASKPIAEDASPQTVFHKPIAQVQKAAVDALVVTGFDVTKKEPTYVSGFRPRKMGLMVGSGGETVGIWLNSQGPNETGVRVDTAKSLVGIIGQKNWNTAVLEEMTKSLAE